MDTLDDKRGIRPGRGILGNQIVKSLKRRGYFENKRNRLPETIYPNEAVNKVRSALERRNTCHDHGDTRE